MEKNRQPPQEQPQGDHDMTLEEDDDTATLEDAGMQKDTPEEIETMNKMWLVEKVKVL